MNINANNDLANILGADSGKPAPDYYWRKYEGGVSVDAVPAGHTPSGEITYIGQVLAIGLGLDALLPGTLYPSRKEVVSAYKSAYASNKYAAVLCTSTPNKLKWYRTNNDEIHLIHDHLVVGGYEINQNAYIGRVSYDNYLIVGKVLTDTYKGLRIGLLDGREKLFTSFEVLVYDL
ncbi:hypothetical protein Trydic_g9639 [Trypoxylus dichotomus]